MYFISLTYIIFLAAALFLYYLMPKRLRWTALLAASYSFYLWGGGYKTVGYLIFTTAVTFASGLILDKLNNIKASVPKSDKEQIDSITKKKKLTVAMTCVICFGMLYMLKYLGFTASAISSFLSLFGKDASLQTPNFLMPLGVSFYIFQSIGYVIDCYRGKYSAERNFFKFALFTSFFPQIIQGPISRHSQLANQLSEPNSLDFDNIRDGIQRMMWGFFKKTVIADRAAVIVNTFFADYDSYSGSITAFAILMYCVNLYCDFSGGIDITVGSAKLFGITMEENFKRPIFATSLADYWRRWHITLGGWMRDYVFYPLSLSKSFGKIGKWARNKIGGKFGKILPTTLATFIIYLIIGIWHGANFRYIAYGFWNGAIITSSVLLANVYSNAKKKLKINSDATYWKIFGMLRTSFIVFLGRYITRSPRLLVGLELIVRTFNPMTFAPRDLLSGTVTSLGLEQNDLLVILFGVIALLAVEFVEEKLAEKYPSFSGWLNERAGFIQFIFTLAIVLAILFFGIMRGSYISSEFIYKQY